MQRAVVVTLGVAMLTTLVGVSGEATGIAPIVRILAENVLGEGSVTALTVTENGSRVQIRWESATYRTEHSLGKKRELLYAEAELATGSIMGRLTAITRVRFAIVRGERYLAGGQNVRGQGLVLMLAPELGGGIYVPPAKGNAASSGGGSGSVKGD